MKIKVSEPDGPYSAELDPGVMDVTLEEVFNGVKLVTKTGEGLTICMRDSGFEVRYFSESEGRKFDMGVTTFDDGLMTHEYYNLG